MPETGSKIVTWDKFAGGDYGETGGERAAEGTFSATNMLVYGNGMLGLRPGFMDVTPTEMPTGKLLALVLTPVVGRGGIFVIGDTVYRFDLGNVSSAPVVVGTFDVAPTVPLHFFLVVDTFFVAVPNDKIYRVDPTNDEVQPVIGVGTSPGGRDVVVLNGQMIVACDGSDVTQPLYRLMASKPGDVNDWSEGRFIDVGDNWQITGIRPQRNGLAILKRESAHTLTGYIGDPETEVDRTSSTALTSLQPYHAEIDDQERYWFIPVFRDNVATFYGGAVDEYPKLRFKQHEHDDGTQLPQLQGMTRLQGDQNATSIAAVRGGSSQQVLLFHNNAWTKHDIDVDISGMCAGLNSNTVLALTDGGGDSSAAKIYWAWIALNRPSLVSDTFAQPSDGDADPLIGQVTLPQYWTSDGRETKVRQVIVDFEVWNTYTTVQNHFDVGVRVMGRDANRGAAAALTYTTESDEPNSYHEDTDASDVEGTLKRQVFNFKCEYGAGFEISLFNIRGCAFRAITVMHDPRPPRPMN